MTENEMLNELQPDLRELLDLVRKVENFDATLAASQMAGKPIEATQDAYDLAAVQVDHARM